MYRTRGDLSSSLALPRYYDNRFCFESSTNNKFHFCFIFPSLCPISESTFFLSLTSNFSICKLTDVELVEGKRLRAEPHFSRDLLRLMVPQAKATILPSVACAEDFDSLYYCLAA